MSADDQVLGGPVDEIRYFVADMSEEHLRVLARRVLGAMLLEDGKNDEYAGNDDQISGADLVDALGDTLRMLRITRDRVHRLGGDAVRAAKYEECSTQLTAPRLSVCRYSTHVLIAVFDGLTVARDFERVDRAEEEAAVARLTQWASERTAAGAPPLEIVHPVVTRMVATSGKRRRR